MKLAGADISDKMYLISLEELSNDESTKWNKVHGILDVFPHCLTEEEVDKTLLGGENPLIEHNVTNEPKFIDFLKRAMHINGEIIIETAFEDFSSERILFHLEKLDNKGKLLLLDVIRTHNFASNYLKTTNFEVVQLFLKFATRELAFPVFHFTKFKMSLCGNYDLSFPIFFESKEVKNQYSEIARQAGLFIR